MGLQGRQFWHLQDWMNSSALSSRIGSAVLTDRDTPWGQIYNKYWLEMNWPENGPETIESVWGYCWILYSHRYHCLWESSPSSSPPPCLLALLLLHSVRGRGRYSPANPHLYIYTMERHILEGHYLESHIYYDFAPGTFTRGSRISGLVQFCSSWHSKYWGQKIKFDKRKLHVAVICWAPLQAPVKWDCVLILGLAV